MSQKEPMKLNDYKETGDSVQKQTHVTFNNPDHEDVNLKGEEANEAKKRFQAALDIQSSSIDRAALVGDFLVAVNNGEIEDFIQETQTQ